MSATDGLAPGRLWSLWDMLRSYLPIYQIAIDLAALRAPCELLRHSKREVSESDAGRFRTLLEAIIRECPNHGCAHTAELAARILREPPPISEVELVSALNHLSYSLTNELEKEAVFRVPPERKGYFERDGSFGPEVATLFGPEVATSFPSCEWDIRQAGNCYALGQGDGCVHHLMLVLERGLNALAAKLGVPYERSNWQIIIQNNANKLKSHGPEFDFHRDVNAKFGILKDAYRNHSEHARDDHYNIHRARGVLDDVSDFMRTLAKGGLSLPV